MYIYHNFFIHSSVDGYLGCFHNLAIVNSAAVNKGIHLSLSILVSSGHMPRSAITGSYGGFIPSFLRNLYTIFHNDCINLHTVQKVQKHSLFSTPSPASIICRIFDGSHSDQCEVISHHSFHLHFSNNEGC